MGDFTWDGGEFAGEPLLREFRRFPNVQGHLVVYLVLLAARV